MQIMNRPKETSLFGTLEVGDVFEYLGGLYLKINPVYPIEPNDDIEEIKDFIELCNPVNAYNLTSHKLNCTFDDYSVVQPVKATLVIE